jgi:cobalt-zinc-cadmium resistance protein CzcA
MDKDGTSRIVDNPDTVEGIVLLQKGDDSDPVLDGIHAEVERLNHGILPKGVKVVPFPRPLRSW